MLSQPERVSPLHVMIDIETLAVTPDALILSIGAVLFDPLGWSPDGTLQDAGTFHMGVERQLQIDMGRKIDASTLDFWLERDDKARDAVFFMPGRETLPVVLQVLRLFVHNAQPAGVWAMGPNFDLTILEHAYRQCSGVIPWSYSAHRDVRTVFELASLDRSSVPPVGISHNALDDATWQALAVQAAYHKLGLSRAAQHDQDAVARLVGDAP